ncbi:hypothetical protein BH11CYA1_BH11CYA1_27340 [soil metagenome]
MNLPSTLKRLTQVALLAVLLTTAINIRPAIAEPSSGTKETSVQLFKRDYSIHPILKTRAFADLVKEPSLADFRALADIGPDSNYTEHFKAESTAARTFCHLIESGQLTEYMASQDCDNQERRQDILFGYSPIPVRIYFLNGKITKAEVRWKGFVGNKLESISESDVEASRMDEHKKVMYSLNLLIGKSKAAITGSEGKPIVELGFNNIWDSRKEITGNWLYFTKFRYPMRLAFDDETCVDACILSQGQVHDFMIWQISRFRGTKKYKLPANLAHCKIPEDGPEGMSLDKIVALYGKPQKVETSGKQMTLCYPVHNNAWCELTLTDGKCDEHVGMMAQTGGVPYSQFDN